MYNSQNVIIRLLIKNLHRHHHHHQKPIADIGDCTQVITASSTTNKEIKNTLPQEEEEPFSAFLFIREFTIVVRIV